MKAKSKAKTETNVTSYKIRGGKLIRRTEKEQAELDQLKAERYGSPEEGSAGIGGVRMKEKFIMIAESQALKLRQIGSFGCAMIFLILLYQKFCHRGKPFLMPIEPLVEEGFSRTTQWRAIARLEKHGLISVKRRHRQPPSITVL
jgi:hypothetical protein